MSLTPAQAEFVAAHRWALVATTGPSGAPQVTMVAYAWDGAVVISTRRKSVKWRNVLARPRIAVTITDDQRCLTLYGTAEAVTEDPPRAALTEVVKASLLADHATLLQADIDRGLEASGRVVIRLVPERAVGRV
jgi:PPOX class probable F420-dependent enzyme